MKDPVDTPRTRRPAFRLRTVFHPSDFSEGDRPAFLHALRIALETGAELDLLHVERRPSEASWQDFPKVRDILESWRRAGIPGLPADLTAEHLRVHKVKVGSHDRVGSIAHYLEESQPNLVVLATHQRRGFDRWIHGAVAEPIARRSRMLTLFVPRACQGFVAEADGAFRLRQVLVAVDWQPAPGYALEKAVDFVQALHRPEGTLTVVHLGAQMPPLHAPVVAGWRIQPLVLPGAVVPRILDTARETAADLIVMATRGHQGFLGALGGSITERVLHRAPCPVLAVPVSRL